MNVVFSRVMVAAFVHLLIATAAAGASDDVLNTVYRIDNQEVRLTDGRAEAEAAPGSASRIITQVVGDPIFGDLNDNGSEDAALFLLQDTGGSGTFFFVAAAISIDGHWQGTNAVFIGDRVTPATIHISKGVIAARYVDRRPDQPMTDTPSVSKSVHLNVNNGHLAVIQPWR